MVQIRNNAKVPTLRLPAATSARELRFKLDGFSRFQETFGHACEQLIDCHTEAGACIGYMRLSSSVSSVGFSLEFPGEIKSVSSGEEFGLLIRLADDGHLYTIWIPSSTHRGTFDGNGRLARSSGKGFGHWDIDGQLRFKVPTNGRGCEEEMLSYLVIDDPSGAHFRDLDPRLPVERKRYLKSCWFDAQVPADVWHYLINGSIYDPRHDNLGQKSVKCQQCAYAWWTYFHFLHHQTQKPVYRLLRDEIAFTVLLDQDVDGGWRHGCWYEEMETHARFFLDGIHLLLSQYEESGQPRWLNAASEAMDGFLKCMGEELADGNLWFLHDTVEDRRRHVFASRALGKLPSNSLCLNTHIQALTVLFRFLKHPEAKEAFRGAAEKGLRALQAALNLNGGGRVYKRLMAWIFRTHFEKEAPTRWKIYTQSFRIHATGRIYWPLRQRYPRLVQPSGFIERDLSLAFASHGYHVLNLKDLLVLYDQTRLNWLVPYIEGGMRYLRGLDWDRWMQRDPLFVELPDVLQLYDRLISSVPQNEVHRVEEALNKVKGGVSLDFATQATLAFSKEPRAGQFADAVRSCLGVTG